MSRRSCTTARLLAVGLLITTAALPTPARAAEPTSAAEAWKAKNYKEAERLSRRAIEDGNLSPAEVVDNYVRLGASRSMQGKKDQAIAAFRAAAVLNAEFLLPAESDAKVVNLSNKAKLDVASLGSIQLSASMPKNVEPHTAIVVRAELDAEHVRLAQKIGVVAKDGTSGKTHEQSLDSAEQVEFQLPAELALAGAVIKVQVNALDRFSNRLASVDDSVRVNGDGEVAKVVTAPTGADKDKQRKGGGFWASPWPWAIGGTLLLAAGGASAYYFWLRPVDEVTIGPANVTIR